MKTIFLVVVMCLRMGDCQELHYPLPVSAPMAACQAAVDPASRTNIYIKATWCQYEIVGPAYAIDHSYDGSTRTFPLKGTSFDPDK